MKEIDPDLLLEALDLRRKRARRMAQNNFVAPIVESVFQQIIDCVKEARK